MKASFTFNGVDYTVRYNLSGGCEYRQTLHLGGRWLPTAPCIANTSLSPAFRRAMADAVAHVLRSC